MSKSEEVPVLTPEPVAQLEQTAKQQDGLHRQLKLAHLIYAMVAPILFAVWQTSAFYTKMNILEVRVNELKTQVGVEVTALRTQVDALNKSVGELVGQSKVNK